jgi:protein SEY1
VADLLVVNLWTKEVGRYTASQYGIIRTIMELNIRLFKQ